VSGPAIRSEGLTASPISDMVFRNVHVGRASAPVFVNTHSSTFDNVIINGVPVAPVARY
jgi:hypothetical protein